MVRCSWVILKTKETKTFGAYCHRIIGDKLLTFGEPQRVLETLLRPVFSQPIFVPPDFYSSSLVFFGSVETQKIFISFGLKVNTLKIDTASISDNLIKPANWKGTNISNECK